MIKAKPRLSALAAAALAIAAPALAAPPHAAPGANDSASAAPPKAAVPMIHDHASGHPAGHGAGQGGGMAAAPLATASLVHADGTPAGTARLIAMPDHVMLHLSLTGIAPGVHGVHLHMVGTCEGPGFTTAGGHLNPAGHQHGMDNPAGSHLGDLPNATADAAGKVESRFGLKLAPATLEQALFDADGTAVVVHAAADDYKTDPSGNSGARIACGVLTKG